MSKYYLPLSGGKLSGGLYIGDNITIWSSDEGGNIVITSPNSIRWEIDAFDDDFRIYSNENSTLKGFRLYRNGNITTTDGGTFLNSNNYTTWASPISHTHSYLPLTGGTLTGNIEITTGNLTVQNGSVISSGGFGDGKNISLYTDIEGGTINLRSKNGYSWEMDSYNDTDFRLFSWYSGSASGFSFKYDGSLSSSKGTFPTASLSGTTLTITI